MNTNLTNIYCDRNSAESTITPEKARWLFIDLVSQIRASPVQRPNLTAKILLEYSIPPPDKPSDAVSKSYASQISIPVNAGFRKFVRQTNKGFGELEKKVIGDLEHEQQSPNTMPRLKHSYKAQINEVDVLEVIYAESDLIKDAKKPGTSGVPRETTVVTVNINKYALQKIGLSENYLKAYTGRQKLYAEQKP